ncbi:hypothetical protein BX666DRAFT_1848869 [Dichotomocladium elegans]|nr:hypothetical protein BX666DRAFT_1848869 [Dichotomocladium elegans]
MSSFLPTPDTPVTSASSLTLLKTPFGSHRRTSGPPTGAADKERPYACTECSQRFSRPHNLKSHLTTHSSERPFQCNVCNSFFRRHHDLKRHKKLHTGERPYQCKNCHRSFARLDALNRHCRAEGGTACNNAATKHHHQEHQRPIVPQLHIAHPASQPLPSIFFHRHHPSPSTSPSPPTHTTSPNISPPAATKTILSAPLSSSKRTLILPSFKDPWEENTQLRHELAYWKAKAAQMSELQSQLHDLQVEASTVY